MKTNCITKDCNEPTDDGAPYCSLRHRAEYQRRARTTTELRTPVTERVRLAPEGTKEREAQDHWAARARRIVVDNTRNQQ